MIPEALNLSEAEAEDVAYTLRDLKPEDIDMKWISNMVHRLLKELEKQLKAVEKFAGSAQPHEVERHFKNARTLNTLRQTFAEAVKLKSDCDAKLKPSDEMKRGERRAALQRKFDQVVERELASGILSKPNGR